jgi:hypothetical protein
MNGLRHVLLAARRGDYTRFPCARKRWLTETADAVCGGNPWASTFLDTFRHLDQLGRLARAGVRVVMHNTLAASDYGLLEERTFRPRPNYWGAPLWRHLMGTTVLDAGVRGGWSRRRGRSGRRRMIGFMTVSAARARPGHRSKAVIRPPVVSLEPTLPASSRSRRLRASRLRFSNRASQATRVQSNRGCSISNASS